MSDSRLSIQHLSKSFDKHQVIQNFELELARGELVSLLGKSGCGKTTVLRLVAGFLQPDAGEIFLDGGALSSLPPEKRPVCTVFQDYALFPHLRVFDNVAYGLRNTGKTKAEIRIRVEEMLEAVELLALASAPIGTLSGGQKQRVALARALVLEPKVLLLDEPFSSLDTALRSQMQHFLKQLQTQFSLTILLVTHDRNEAMRLSDQIAVMQSGQIIQKGSPRFLYENPASVGVAHSLGEINALSLNGHLALVRPEHVSLHPTDTLGKYPGRISAHSFLGATDSYTVFCPDFNLEITAILPTGKSEPMPVGQAVFVNLDRICFL